MSESKRIPKYHDGDIVYAYDRLWEHDVKGIIRHGEYNEHIATIMYAVEVIEEKPAARITPYHKCCGYVPSKNGLWLFEEEIISVEKHSKKETGKKKISILQRIFKCRNTP